MGFTRAQENLILRLAVEHENNETFDNVLIFNEIGMLAFCEDFKKLLASEEWMAE